MELQFVEFEGYDLATRIVGEGVDVVCVHGWPLHGQTFRMLVDIPGFRFHLIDLPGTGTTRIHGERSLSIPSQAQVIVDYVKQLDTDRVVFVAHDSGGAVSRYAAAELGSIVRGIVLSGTEIPRKYPAALKAFIAAANTPLASGLTKLLTSESLGSMAGVPTDPEFRKLFLDRLKDAEILKGYIGIGRDFLFSDLDKLDEIHAQIEAPVILLWGTKDAFFPVSDAEEMASQFSGSTAFHAYDGAGVFVHEEQPDWYREHVSRFLAAVV